jgi:hypothetical protein
MTNITRIRLMFYLRPVEMRSQANSKRVHRLEIDIHRRAMSTRVSPLNGISTRSFYILLEWFHTTVERVRPTCSKHL